MWDSVIGNTPLETYLCCLPQFRHFILSWWLCLKDHPSYFMWTFVSINPHSTYKNLLNFPQKQEDGKSLYPYANVSAKRRIQDGRTSAKIYFLLLELAIYCSCYILHWTKQWDCASGFRIPQRQEDQLSWAQYPGQAYEGWVQLFRCPFLLSPEWKFNHPNVYNLWRFVAQGKF